LCVRSGDIIAKLGADHRLDLAFAELLGHLFQIGSGNRTFQAAHSEIDSQHGRFIQN